MPWCPNCKTEYREGITHCADCKTELVEEYKDAVLQNATAMLVNVEAGDYSVAKKLHDFLAYSGITSVILIEGEKVGVYVVPEELSKAKKCFKAFYSVEMELAMQRNAETSFLQGEDYDDYFGDDEEVNEESVEELEDALIQACTSGGAKAPVELLKEAKPEKRYVSAVSRYDDYRSSGSTFTVLGGLGIVFALLNFMDVIPGFGSTFSSVVLFIMFGIFLALGIFSFVKAGTLKEGAEQEKQTVAKVKAWMETNFTKDMLVSVADDEDNEEIKTEELLYMDRLDQLVDRVLHEFPGLHDSLAEQLVDEFFGQ